MSRAPAGSAYETEQQEMERVTAYERYKEIRSQADAVADALLRADAVSTIGATADVDFDIQPAAKATASAIELGTFEPGHDESDLTTTEVADVSVDV